MNTTQKKFFDKKKFLSTYTERKPIQRNLLRYLSYIQDNGGPKEEDFQQINKVLNYYRDHISRESAEKISKKVIPIFGDSFVNSLMGHATLKPRGYAGDFEVIDLMYQQHTSDNNTLANWDRFYNWHAAAKAVRNRKQFFKNEIKQHLDKPFHVLNIASGPCRDMLEVFEEAKPKQLLFDCVETDINAILHATRLNRHHLQNITFHNKNIFRFHTEKQYDLIWSAGLFDYFDDKTFAKLLGRIQKYVKPGGQIIIGNFAAGNATLGYMELILGWYLHHRTNEQMIDLARTACGTNLKNVVIDQEPEGVNLFMRLQF